VAAVTAFQEAQEGFRGSMLRAHDDAVRLAYEKGMEHGAAEEREACAAIAKAHHDALDPDDDSTARNEAAVIEGEIRARGSK
jgi:hypothetical protein